MPTPVVWLKLDEATGNFADSGSDGTAWTPSASVVRQQATILTDGGYSAHSGNAGIALRSSVPAALSGTTNQSISFWYYKPSSSNQSGQIVHLGNGSTGWGLGIGNGSNTISNGNRLMLLVGGVAFYSPGSLTFGVGWTHVVAVHTTGSNFAIYLNGSLAVSSTYGTVLTPSADMTVGLLAGAGSSYNLDTGNGVDDVRFYDVALTSGEVTAIYNSALSTGTTVTAGQAAETDTALAATAKTGTTATVGQPTETDTALAATALAGAVVAADQADETDTALAASVELVTPITVTTGQAGETETGLAATALAGAVVAADQADETDTALAVTPLVGATVPAGQATETDEALPATAVIDASDAENDAYKLTLDGWGVASWEPAPVPVPASLVTIQHSVISAIAYGPVTMVGTQPTFTYSEADKPRMRERVLLGGRDITYDRDVPIPEVEYELADLLLYGPGTLELPAYMASWEIGTDALDRASQGRRVKVQLVDDTDPEHPTVAATTYKGFVEDPNVSGRNLVLDLAGEAQGRLALRDSHVLFKRVHDIKRLLWAEFRDVGVRFPRLGEPGIGINSLNFGGMGKLEKVEELVARMVKKDGTQRAVLPDESGRYDVIDKDTTTAHFSVFVDDSFTVADLSSDLAEKPNAIYATAVAPNGTRIDGAAVGGLVKTPAPDYPMDDDSNFGEGTTNEDTDSGDGVSILVNRLGAVGLLDIRDTPGGFDDDVVDALEKLQNRAKISGPVGVMTPALWRVLWDLDVTGRDPSWATIQPTAQHTSTQRYLRAASGAPLGLNPDFDPDAIQVDESIDMGSGFRERQVQNWSETRVHAPDEKVWYGTITVHMGAVLAGQVEVGDTITSADLRDARLVQPGRHNLYVPNFDGGTLFGVAGVQRNDGTLVFTVDTRHRPAREIWERRQVRKETKSDPARRMMGTRQSTLSKDAVRGFISWGGILDRDVALTGGSWTKVELVVGDYGTLARFRTVVQGISGGGGDVVITGHEHAVALFGKSPADKQMTEARLNDLVPAPLAENGDRPWRRKATREILKAHGFMEAWGTHEEPAGYGGDLKTDAAPLTGVEEVTDIPFEGAEGYRVDVFVWVATDTKLRSGRMAWPLLESGV